MSLAPASFYSTYEELKHQGATKTAIEKAKFLQYLWGIETLRKNVMNPRNLNCFYSTYEELKLCKGFLYPHQ